jgi:hypothetical protein
MWLAAVNSIGFTLKYTPREFIDYNLCLAAVTNDGIALQYVPKRFKKYNLCLAAVNNRSWAFQYVPVKLKTFKLLLLALENLEENLDGKAIVDYRILTRDEKEFLYMKYNI